MRIDTGAYLRLCSGGEVWITAPHAGAFCDSAGCAAATMGPSQWTYRAFSLTVADKNSLVAWGGGRAKSNRLCDSAASR
jgi:hypothetical protein